MPDNEFTTGDIMGLTGLNRKTVWRNLKKIAKVGLIIPQKKGHWKSIISKSRFSLFEIYKDKPSLMLEAIRENPGFWFHFCSILIRSYLLTIKQKKLENINIDNATYLKVKSFSKNIFWILIAIFLMTLKIYPGEKEDYAHALDGITLTEGFDSLSTQLQNLLNLGGKSVSEAFNEVLNEAIQHRIL